VPALPPGLRDSPLFGVITTRGSYITAAGGLSGLTDLSTKSICSAGSVMRGSIDASTGGISIQDRVIFQNYLKTGDTIGVLNSVGPTCMDVNFDQIVNETDLNILEKMLKGYLYTNVPTSE
jgi:hypothetical protein